MDSTTPRLTVDIPRAKINALLQEMLAKANQEPQEGSLPLFIAGHRCGVVYPPALASLRELPVAHVTANAIHIGSTMAPGPELNTVLAQIALALRNAGRAPGWRNELLDVWAETNESIAAIERGVVRPLGLVTRAVHLNGWSQDGGLWVARRALTKATDPGMWDTLVGGLISFQEPADLALTRESDEEAGLDEHQIAHRTPLRTITRMRRRVAEGYQLEDVLTCECILGQRVVPQNRDGEVMEIACLSPEQIFLMLGHGEFTTEASIVLADELARRSIT